MIDKNKNYTTMDGLEVRIYATDGTGNFPVHGAVLSNCGWILAEWSEDGDHPTVSDFNIIKKWEPELNEYCWFYDNSSLFTKFSKFKGFEGSHYIDDDGGYWQNCSQFIGTLPPHIVKDEELNNE